MFAREQKQIQLNFQKSKEEILFFSHDTSTKKNTFWITISVTMTFFLMRHCGSEKAQRGFRPLVWTRDPPPQEMVWCLPILSSMTGRSHCSPSGWGQGARQQTRQLPAPAFSRILREKKPPITQLMLLWRWAALSRQTLETAHRT